MSIIEERQHGDILEHRHEGYDYWHPVTRVHCQDPSVGTPVQLPEGHILARVVPYSGEPEQPRGLQVQPFDWATWDEGCEAKGMCQGYHSVQPTKTIQGDCPEGCSEPQCGRYIYADLFELWSEGETGELCTNLHTVTGNTELHHRNVSPDLVGLAEAYWQCPHCRQLQKPIQWIQGARLETYNLEVRSNRTLIWVKVSSGQWFLLITHGTLQGVAMGRYDGTVYVVGNHTPLQLPDECAIILARRMWYRLTKGYWLDKVRRIADERGANQKSRA